MPWCYPVLKDYCLKFLLRNFEIWTILNCFFFLFLHHAIRLLQHGIVLWSFHFTFTAMLWYEVGSNLDCKSNLSFTCFAGWIEEHCSCFVAGSTLLAEWVLPSSAYCMQCTDELVHTGLKLPQVRRTLRGPAYMEVNSQEFIGKCLLKRKIEEVRCHGFKVEM